MEIRADHLRMVENGAVEFIQGMHTELLPAPRLFLLHTLRSGARLGCRAALQGAGVHGHETIPVADTTMMVVDPQWTISVK